MPRSPITKLKPFNLDSTANYTFTNASVAGIINVGAVQTNSLLYSNGQPWSFSGGGGSGNTIPGGETGAVQFNGGGNFAGSSQFTFNTNTNTLFVNNIQSNGSLLTNLPGSNVTGQVGNALVSGTVYNNAQPNITSVGTLTSLTVTGNVSASYFVGNGSTLTGINGSNVAGTVANANYATYSGTAYSVSASNVSGLGNIATINLDGNVSNILRGDGSWGPESSSTNANYANFAGTAYSVSASNISGTVANANFATYANYATFSGTATTADTANSVSGSNVTGQVSNSLVAGTVYTNSQPNITSVGTLTSLTVTGNVTASYFIGNGSQLTGLPVTYSNANVAAYLPTYTGNFTAGNATITGTLAVPTITTTGSGGNISGADYIVANYFTGTLTTNAQPNITSVGTLTSLSVTGNVTASYFIGNGSTLSSINGSNVTGQVGNSLVAGTVYTNAQPNITSLGTLTSLTVTGNVSASYFIGNGSQLTGLPASYSNANVAAYLPTYTGNLLAGNANITGTLTVPSITTSGSGGNITGADYIIANYFNGNGSLLSGIIGANVTGTVSSATSATTAGTVTTASQPNITSVGSLTGLTVSGDATVSGNLTVGGNTSYINVTVLSVKDPIIELGGGTNGAPLSTNDGKDRGTLLHYYTSTTVDAFMGWDNSNAEFAFGSNVSVSSEVVTFNSYGNLRAGYFIGDGSQLTGLPASYSNSNVAAYLLTNTGNVSAGYFIGDGSTLTNITAANVIGQVSNALVSGTVYTNSQPNITSLGTLTSLTVNGTVNLGSVANVNISGGSNGQLLTTYGNGALYWGNATSGSPAQFTIDTFTGDGTTTTYTLSTTPSGIDNLIVNYNGSFQLKNAYTLSGANITFTGTPNTGSTIEVFTLTGSGGGGGGGSALTIKDEGSTLSTAVTSIDFVGSGVTATNVGNAVTVSVSGASNTSIRAQAMTMGILFGG